MRYLGLIPVMLLLATPGLGAQEHGMPANCHGMLTATLASGRAHGNLQGCGSVLAHELANAIRRASIQDDTARLARILSYSYSIKDPDVFSAALDLAHDRKARPRARALGLVVAIAQYDPQLSFQGGGRSAGAIFLEAPTPPECTEIVFLSAPGEPWYDRALPTGSEDRLRDAVTSLRGPAEPSAVVRGLAQCAALLLPEPPQPALAAGSVSLASTCDEFIVTNNTGWRLELEYVIETNEPERGTIVLLPRGREGILHDGKGALRLMQGSQTVAYQQLDATRCPRR